MTPKERVRAAMELKPVDRIPVFPVVTAYLGSRALERRYKDMVLNPALVYDGLRAIHRRFGFDGFEVGLGPGRNSPTPKTAVRDGVSYLMDPSGQKPVARLEDDDMPVPLAGTPLLSDKSALDSITVTRASEYVDAGCTAPVEELMRELGDQAFVAGVAGGQSMNSLVAWRGSEQAILDLTDDPAFVHEAMERATAISIEVGKALIQAGVDGIYIGDAWASASIISPRMYEEFCLPYHHKAAAEFQKLGTKVYLHVCGNSGPLAELMAATGVDAIEPLDVDGGVDLEDVKARVGDRVCLKGGVSTALLLGGTPGQVYADAGRCIEILGPRGHILGSADDIPRDTPFANIDAMVQAAADYC